MNRKLSELRPGEKGVILEFGSEEIYLKLMEMGCLPGEPIAIEQVALTGDPLSVHVAGYRLSLRRDEADHIIVSTKD